MFKRMVLVVATVLVIVFSVGATFKNRTWKTDFPYIGAFFCHNDDYVRFYCTQDMHRFYYMTAKDSSAFVEFYIDGVRQGVINELPANKWNSRHFSIANWTHFDLGPGFIGHEVEIHFRENVTVNGVRCPENDIMIKLEDNSLATLWKNVDSTTYCDLDLFAK
ncbi:hypothetical protein [Pseudothermotoga sp.]